ncbi:MAG: hypothetical protein ACI4TI_03050 [Christensenellales bacterium]
MKQYNFKLVYKKYNKTENIIKNCVILFFLLIFSVLAVLYGLGKFQILHILTNSSAPFHPAGSLAIEYKVDFDDLEVGDFVTWSSTKGKTFVTHQLVKIDKENRTFVCSQQQFNEDHTQVLPIEEWNPANFDGTHTEDQYYGKVLFSIPKLGVYMTALKEMVITNSGINVLGIVIIALAFVVYYLVAKFLSVPTYVLREKQN